MLPHPSATNLLRGRAGGTDTPRSFDSTVEERDESTMLLDSHSRDEGADSDALPKNYGTAASRQHDEISKSPLFHHLMTDCPQGVAPQGVR